MSKEIIVYKEDLLLAASNGHTKTAELLISKGVDVNAKDDDGETPLYRAALVRPH